VRRIEMGDVSAVVPCLTRLGTIRPTNRAGQRRVSRVRFGQASHLSFIQPGQLPQCLDDKVHCGHIAEKE
jgi:hypothetical protein